MTSGAARGVAVTLLLLVAAAPGGADTPIATLNAGLIQAEKTGKSPFQQRYMALAPAIDQAFDLPQILHAIVGLRWAQISPDQQKTLLEVFRAYTICNYVANFDNYSGDAIRILPQTRAVGSDQVIETEIVPQSGDPTRIDYVMRNGASGWKAIDVLQQGTISQAAVQRSDFRSLLTGGGATALIDRLKQKVKSLSGGTLSP
jgi:phospholipid transport system substrate-binding protein